MKNGSRIVTSTMNSSQSLATEFRQAGEVTANLIEAYVKRLTDKPDLVEVRRTNIRPGECANGILGLPEGVCPEKGLRDWSIICDSIERCVLPYLTHWQHPRFLAYYPSSTSLPAVWSDAIVTAVNNVSLQWSASPASTELEVVVMDELAKMFGLACDSSDPFLHSSGKGGGLVQSTASDGAVVVMCAARTKKIMKLLNLSYSAEILQEDLEKVYVNEKFARFVAYTSDQVHFSVRKACRVAGIRSKLIPVVMLSNGNYGLDVAALERQIEEDIREGLIPCALVLTFGTTNTCGIDPIRECDEIAKKHDLWVHVDAAYAGPCLMLPEFKEHASSIKHCANSVITNLSKWFLCGVDSSLLFVDNKRYLNIVFSASDVYMKDAVTCNDNTFAPEFKDWAVPLGRKFRSLRIWSTLQYFGKDGLEAYLRSSIQQADILRNVLQSNPNVFDEIVVTQLGLVCFALKTNELTDQLVSSISSKYAGKYLIYGSEMEGRKFVRVACGGAFSDAGILREVAEVVLAEAKLLCNESVDAAK